jgi:hypothetical protein
MAAPMTVEQMLGQLPQLEAMCHSLYMAQVTAHHHGGSACS